MKRFLLCLVLVAGIAAMAQDAPATPESDVYNVAGLQVKPEYPGGMKAFYQFISNNFHVPDLDLEEDFVAKIFVSFVIEKDGSLSGIKVVRDAGYGLGNEAVRVLKLSKKWTPGMQNGQVVRTSYSLPVSINIEGTPKQKEEFAGEPHTEEPEPVKEKVKTEPKGKKTVTTSSSTKKKKKA
ncbi:energy transducer TonB [Flavobacterium sp. DGU11]|uniref:Energy transducer TonB n=1 Tax=Flavobacterium arundinis TaxID=3139143 RepID=A0ABU9I014_9FLAO